jgi:hypothetical protein
MIKLPMSSTALLDYSAFVAQALHFQCQSESSVWNWFFRGDRPNWFYLNKLIPVVTVSRAFGLKPLPNQSLHGSGPRFVLLANTFLSAP